MPRAKRVVLLSHVAATTEMTGAEKSLLSLAAQLHADGRDVVFVAPSPGQSTERAHALGLRVLILPWPQLWLASWTANPIATLLRIARFVGLAWRLTRLAHHLRTLRPAVVLCNSLVNVGAALAAHRAGLPVVWRVAELPGPGVRRRLLSALTERYGNRVVCVSHAVAAALPNSATTVVHSGVEIAMLEEVVKSRAELHTTLDLPASEVVVGHAGQLRPHKGQLEFVRAAVRAAASLPVSTIFAILGAESDANYTAVLHTAAKPLGDRLRFPGFVAGGPAGLDLLVFTSTAPDPFPRVVLEAMAAGVAIIAFRGGGVDEAIVDGVTGRLVRTGDIDALAAAIVELSRDHVRRLQMGKAGQARAATLFKASAVAARYAAIIDEVAP